MAHNTRVRADLAEWATNSVVTNVEFNKIDTLCFESINGDQGGTWAPANQIIIGGAGLQVTGPFSTTGTVSFGTTEVTNFTATGDVEIGTDFNDSFEVNSSATFNSSVDFVSTADFADTATFSQDVVLDGDPGTYSLTSAVPLVVNSNVTLGATPSGTNTLTNRCNSTHYGTSVFYEAATFNDDVALGSSSSDTLTIAATTTASGPVALNGAVTVGANAVFNGVLTANGSATIGQSASNLLTVHAATVANGPATFNGSVTLCSGTEDTLTMNAAATFNQNVTVASGRTLAVTSTASVGGQLTAGSLAVTGQTTLTGNITCTGNGSIAPKLFLWNADQDETLSFLSYNLIHIPNSVLGANRALTLQYGGSIPDGADYEVFSENTSYYVTVAHIGGSINIGNSSGQYRWARFRASGSGIVYMTGQLIS